MSDDLEDACPQSDPYCIHWASIFSDTHKPTACATCGHSCRNHDPLWGERCSECGCRDWKNSGEPAKAEE